MVNLVRPRSGAGGKVGGEEGAVRGIYEEGGRELYGEGEVAVQRAVRRRQYRGACVITS